MASHPPAQCCTVGIKHEGQPTGKVVKIDDKWDAYIAVPAPEKNHAGAAILFIPDVYGIWQNSQLMADQFAANGYHTLVLDYFNGDPWSQNHPSGDFQKWLKEGSDGKNPHTVDAAEPIVEAAIKTLIEKHGVTKLGAVGYCYGAKFVVRHFKSGIKAGYLAHPSFIEEEELEAISGPLSIAAAETDSIFTTDKRHKSEDILKRTAQPYQLNLYSGVSHGFAVRGNLNDKKETFAREQAFLQAVKWFDNWLL